MKKNKYSAFLLGAFLAGASALAQASCHGMALHAHRGSHEAPENSLRAVQRAFDGGWDGAEIDIQRLRDNAWILHHDPLLGRTTTLRQRRSSDLDSRIWREVRLRDRKGEVSTEPAAFLADVLVAIGDDEAKVLNVEIKDYPGNCGSAQEAARFLGQHRPNGQWFLTAIERAQLQCIRRIDPHGYVGQIVLDPKSLLQRGRAAPLARQLARQPIDHAWLARLKQEVGAPVGIHVDAAMLDDDPDMLVRARKAGVALFTYSLAGDRAHVSALRAAAARTRLLPSGAVIDGAPEQFCTQLGNP